MPGIKNHISKLITYIGSMLTCKPKKLLPIKPGERERRGDEEEGKEKMKRHNGQRLV